MLIIAQQCWYLILPLACHRIVEFRDISSQVAVAVGIRCVPEQIEPGPWAWPELNGFLPIHEPFARAQIPLPIAILHYIKCVDSPLRPEPGQKN